MACHSKSKMQIYTSRAGNSTAAAALYSSPRNGISRGLKVDAQKFSTICGNGAERSQSKDLSILEKECDRVNNFSGIHNPLRKVRDMTVKTQSMPLVSIVTPAYNEEKYLAECIESVLGQTYPNWDYTIVKDCSTDGTLAIAMKYSAQDPRIRVIGNDTLVPAIANFNIALRQISSTSKYCKIVLADDWIFPECVERMVASMEQYP